MPAADLGPLKPTSKATLARKLDLPLAVLFGLGVTIGAGIYVLIGATAARAGMHAPLAFLLAALVMAPTATSFAELAGRMPVSAGEAAYVRAGFGSEALSLVVGCMVLATGSGAGWRRRREPMWRRGGYRGPASYCAWPYWSATSSADLAKASVLGADRCL